MFSPCLPCESGYSALRHLYPELKTKSLSEIDTLWGKCNMGRNHFPMLLPKCSIMMIYCTNYTIWWIFEFLELFMITNYCDIYVISVFHNTGHYDIQGSLSCSIFISCSDICTPGSTLVNIIVMEVKNSWRM